METTRIPKRISPCNLIDTYVEFKFKTDFNSDLLLNLIRDHKENAIIEIPYGIGYDNNNTQKYYTIEEKGIRFLIKGGELCINIIGEYPGWGNYKKHIESLVFHISDRVSYTNVRLRYVSKWRNIRILDHIDGTIHLDQFEQLFKQTEFSFPARYASDIPDQNVVARVTLKDSIKENGEEFSLVDIDLSSDIPNDKDAESAPNPVNAIRCLNELHIAEKDMFFKLLSEDFINSLNPEW